MTDYVTLAQLRAALNMDSSDTTRDDLLSLAISAASELIDKTTGRTFGLASSATERVFIPCSGDELLIVDDIGSTTGLVVELGHVGDTTWTTVADYEASPLNAIDKGEAATGLTRVGGWGGSRSRVRVTALWGWPSVPDAVEQAAQIQALRLFQRKDSPTGVLGSSEWGFLRLTRADPDVLALVGHLVLPGF